MDVGKTDEVSIMIIEEYSNRFLEQAQAGGAESLEKHRFMIQSKVISDDDYDNMERMTTAQKSDEYQKIWNSEPKDDRFNIKFKAVFNYPDINDMKSSINTNNFDDNNTDIKTTKDKRNLKNVPSENVLEEIVNLRTKLDEVVVYSVYLTAERDTIVSQLEDAKRELSNYKTDKQGKGVGVASKRGENEKKSSGLEQLVILFIVAVISYLAGLYIR